MEDKLLLTVPEAARLLRVSRNSAYELVARGELPAIRLGRTIRIPRTLLEGWLCDQALALTAAREPVDTEIRRTAIGMTSAGAPSAR